MKIVILLIFIFLVGSCSLKGERNYVIDNFEQDLVLWLDGDNIRNDGTSPDNSDLITTWTDQSLNENDADGSASSPSYAANSLGGRGTVLFSDGEWLDIDLGITDSPLTIFTVCRFSQLNQAGGNDDYLYSLGADTANTTISVGRYRDAGANLDKYFAHSGPGQTHFGDPIAGSTWHLITQQSSTSAPYHALRVDQVDMVVADFAAAITTDGTMGIGYSRSSSNGWFWGNLAEIMIFSRKLTGSEIIIIEKYLQQKWGL